MPVLQSKEHVCFDVGYHAQLSDRGAWEKGASITFAEGTVKIWPLGYGSTLQLILIEFFLGQKFPVTSILKIVFRPFSHLPYHFAGRSLVRTFINEPLLEIVHSQSLSSYASILS